MSFFASELSKNCSRLLSKRCKFRSNLFKKIHKQIEVSCIKQSYLNVISCRYYCSNPFDDPQNPITKTWKVLKDDMRDFINKVDRVPEEDNPKKIDCPQECDILIVGGGVIGSSIAYWLKQRTLSGLQIVVLEKDCSVNDSNPNNYNYNKVTSTIISYKVLYFIVY